MNNALFSEIQELNAREIIIARERSRDGPLTNSPPPAGLDNLRGREYTDGEYTDLIPAFPDLSRVSHAENKFTPKFFGRVTSENPKLSLFD